MRTLAVMMAKAPRAGQVKTRLAADVGEAAAADLAAAFIHDLTTTMAAATCDFEIAAGGEVDHPAFNPARALGISIGEQPGGDLGTRLDRIATDAAARSDAFIIMGSDLPTLRASDVDSAFQTLQSTDVVIGPSTDGGYYLVGARSSWFLQSRKALSPHPLFGSIDWSTSRVLQQTLRQAKRCGARLELLPWAFDVDDIDDLQLLRTYLLDYAVPSALDVARHTAILLSTFGPNEDDVGDQE